MLNRRSLVKGLVLSPFAVQGIGTRLAHACTCPAPRLTGEIIAEIDSLARELLQTFDVVGGGVALVQDGEVVFEQGYGLRDRESGQPFTPNTVHRIGSTTKSMTSMLTAMQVERGLFDWNTRLKDITSLFQFPSPELTDSIKVGQLMGMGTGLSESPIELYLDLQSPKEFLRTLPKLPVLYPPFTHYYYNDFVYAVAGFVGLLQQGVPYDSVEKAYAELIKHEILDPIGMTTAAITDNPSDLSDNVSKSYGYDLRFNEKPLRVVTYQPVRMVSPAGAAACTLKEMANYLITQLNGGVTPSGKRIVGSEYLEHTWKAQTPITSTAGYAMGWLNGTVSPDINLIYHTGGVDGFRTEIDMLPDGNIGIVVFANTETGEHYYKSIRGRVIELLHCLEPAAVDAQKALYETEKQAISALRATVTGYSVPESDVAPILGCYKKGWRVEYASGLPMLTRKDGAHLVLLPTAEGYCVASGTYAGAFEYSVNFVPDAKSGMRLLLTDPHGTLIDDLPRLDADC